MGHISLLYHDVINGNAYSSGFRGADADAYKLDEQLFASHLQKIGELEQSSVQLAFAAENTAITSILLTFDDGGASADSPISRMLEARGWRGHFFIVTGKIDQPGFLKTWQIQKLHGRGHLIGSHSHSHPDCFSGLSYEAMLEEWRESRRILREILGEPPMSASVPGGFYSAEVARAAREAGYSLLFTSEPTSRLGRCQELTIVGRYGIKRSTSAVAAQSLAAGKLWARSRQALSWNLKKPLKKLGGPLWLSFRRWFFKQASSASE